MAASTFDDRLKRAVDTLGDRLRDEIARELRVVTDELSTGDSTVITASLPPLQQPSTSLRVLDAVRALDEAASLSAVLDTLIDHATAEGSRAGLFLVHAGGLRAWRDNDRLAETDIMAEAVRTKRAVSRTAAGSEASPFANAAAVAHLHAFPLALSGDVVAVLCVEGGDAATLEVLARHAARLLESFTAFKTARALAAPVTVSASQLAEAPVATVSNDEEAAARQYARLLISEITLYHHDAVEAGQRERDLAVRLGAEIARARSLYGERIPAHLPHAADLFRDELVRTLAGGDASLLADASAA